MRFLYFHGCPEKFHAWIFPTSFLRKIRDNVEMYMGIQGFRSMKAACLSMPASMKEAVMARCLFILSYLQNFSGSCVTV